MRKTGFAITCSGWFVMLVLFSLNVRANAYYDALDDQLISVSTRTENTERINTLIKQGLSTIPSNVKHSLVSSGYKIVIVPMTEDIENPHTHPHGYAEDRGWKNVAGAFKERQRCIFVGERVCRHSDVPVFNKHADETVRHEMGHAYDQYLGYSLKGKGNISASTVFEAADDKDSSELTSQRHHEFHYFLQSGSAGRKELFAELFAALCSSGTNDTMRARRDTMLVLSFP